MLPRWATLVLAIGIGLVWAANVVVGMVDPTRSDPYVHAIFMAVIGAVFGLDRYVARRADPDPPPSPPGLPEPPSPDGASDRGDRP